MQKLTILNSHEVKEIKETLIKEFGFFPSSDFVYLRNETNRIFIINRDLARIDLQKLIVDRVGLYLAEISKERVRLSKEGAQWLAQEAKKEKKKLKNLINLSLEETKRYFKGEDLDKDSGQESRLVLLAYNNKVFGCAQYKQGKILNFLPKEYRGKVIL